MTKQHLTAVQRYVIFLELQNGASQNSIAKKLKVSKSTISREIKRNSDQRDHKYKAEQAQRKSDKRQRNKNHARKLTEEVEEVIVDRLMNEWSPEQIAGRCKKEGIPMVSHETIYGFINRNKQKGGSLHKYLRRQGRKYNKRNNAYKSRGIIANRVDIEERPSIVDEKQRFGDLEIDTVIGRNHKGALLTINDRVTKLAWIVRLEGKSATPLTEAAIRVLTPLKGLLHTITADNGKEFAKHAEIVAGLDIKFYFCKPYHSWERGANENMNGLIRQYIPKKTDFSKLTDEQILRIQNKLNNRPRKTLGWLTPIEMFNKITNYEYVALAT